MTSDPTPPQREEAPDHSTRTVQISGVMTGGMIGPYRLIGQLGEGGMGVVYHAQQVQPIRRDVALKLIKPGMDSRQVIARFESERQALGVMDHTNIARVLDGGATPSGLPYFVMEMVNGIPITQYCDSKRMSVKQRIELLIPVCRAIQHAHQKGIIHRDIKPSNILVTEHEGRPLPKMIDFGLAKALGHQLSDATMTNAGTIVGTLGYMSPEQADIRRQHDVDTRTDVYSLGAVLYELLTGTTPLQGEGMAQAGYMDVLRSICEEEPQPPSARVRRSPVSAEIAALRQSTPARLQTVLHGELDWIAMKALEKDRARRYETVNGVARDLERYLLGEPVEAAPSSAAYRTRKFLRKHRLAFASAAGFAVLLAIGAAVSSWMAIRATRAEAAALAVNDFLQNDLLAQASASQQATPGRKSDPDLKVRTALDRGAARIGDKFGGQPLVEAEIRQTIGNTYTDLGIYKQAQQQIERALELRRRTLGENNPASLSSATLLAYVYELQGNYKEAEPLATSTLKAQRRVLGVAHKDTLDSMVKLAELYRLEAKYSEAETLLKEAISVGSRSFGELYPTVLTAIDDLGSIYVDEGKHQQAEPLLIRAVDGWRRIRGEEHPEALVAMGNLGVVYAREGKYSEAERLTAEALDIRRRVLGPDHQETLRNVNNLAAIYQLEQRYPEAEQLYTHVLAVRRNVLGELHPDTLFTMNRLAGLYRDEGRQPQSEMLFRKVLDLRRQTLGERHPLTLDTLVSLGAIQLEQKKYAEAEANLRAAMQAYDKLPTDAWQRFNCRNLLGACLASKKKFAEAEELLTSGYDGMLERRANIPAGSQTALREAGQRVLDLYRGWEKHDLKVAEWQAKLEANRGLLKP